MLPTPRSVAIIVVCCASVALADDFKTIEGKEYKNATVSRVEPDGIVLRTKSGISKVYFNELPKDVQQRFRRGAISHAQSAQNGVFFLKEPFTIKTKSGLTGLDPGTVVRVVSENGNTLRVTDGINTFDLSKAQVTTDIVEAQITAQNYSAAEEANRQAYNAEFERIQKEQKRVLEENLRQAAAQRQREIDAENAQIQRELRAIQARYEAAEKRRRDREDYIFKQQNKTPDTIIIVQPAPYQAAAPPVRY